MMWAGVWAAARNPVAWIMVGLGFIAGAVYGAQYQKTKDDAAGLRAQVKALELRNVVTFKLQDARYTIQQAASDLIASMTGNLDDAEASARLEASKPDRQCRPDSPDDLGRLQSLILVDPGPKHRARKP